MCLGIPAKIISIDGPTARVEVGGAVTEADISLVTGVSPGDYVIVHAGFAIEKVDERLAEETLRELALFLEKGDVR